MILLKNKFFWLFCVLSAGYLSWELSKPDDLACHFEKGDELVLALSMNSLSKVNPKSMLSSGKRPASKVTQSSTLGFKGRLNLLVEESSSAEYRIRARISDGIGKGDFNNDIIAEIEKPFLLRMDKRCQISSLGFHGSRILAAEETVRLIFQTMSFVMPENPQESSWKHEERDAMGRFLVEYERQEERTVTRKRIRYEKVESPNDEVALTAEVVRSESEGTLAEDGRWLAEASIHERVKLHNAYGDLFADVLTRMSLERLPNAKIPNDLRQNRLQSDQVVWNNAASFAHQKKKISIFDQLPPNPALNAFSLEQVIDGFRVNLAAGGTESRLEAVKKLVAYLRQNEGAYPQLLDYLRDPGLDDKVATWMIFALEKVGTRGSENALVSILESQDFSNMNRVRATHALADTKSLSEKGLSAISGMAQGFGSDQNYDISSASVLALGVVGRNHPEGHTFNEEVRSNIAQLVHGPGSKDDEEYVTTIIHSMGNTNDGYYSDLAKPYLESPSPLVRASAGNVLAKICSKSCLVDLAKRLHKEKEVLAREGLVNGFVERGLQYEDKELIQVLSAHLLAEKVPSVQIHIINSLGPLAKQSQDVKETLVRKYHQEKNAGIKVAIGKFVSAKDILWLVQ